MIEQIVVLTIDKLLKLRSIDVIIRREELYNCVTFQLGIDSSGKLSPTSTGESDTYDNVANHSGPFNQSWFSDSFEGNISLEGMSLGLLTLGQCFQCWNGTKECIVTTWLSTNCLHSQLVYCIQ